MYMNYKKILKLNYNYLMLNDKIKKKLVLKTIN
jgi:hypothetical protein